MRRLGPRIGLVLWALAVSVGAEAEEPVMPRAAAAFTATDPVIDGRADEGAWAKAAPILYPSASSLQSEVRFLWNARGVFLAFKATDSSPVYGHSKPGEPLHLEDVFEVFFDQMGDQKQYFEVQCDPAGQIFMKTYVLTAPPQLTPEGRLTKEFAASEYWRYDWPRPDDLQVQSRIDAATGEWTLEMFLPASLVNRRQNGAPLEPRTMRFNLVRHDWDAPKDAPNRRSSFLYWAPTLSGHPHLSPTRMGYVELKAGQP